MSLYDDAVFALIAEGGAGKDDVLYNIKPEEKVKPTELLENNALLDSTGWHIPSGDASFVSIGNGEIVFTNAVANEYRRIRTDDDTEGRVFELGKTYKISFTVDDFQRSGSDVILRAAEVDNKLILEVTGNGNFSAVYTAQANERFQFKVAGGGSITQTLSCKISNLSIKEVEQAPKDFTFVRGGNLAATRIGPDGKIEKGRENLLLNSNTFSSSDWTKSNVTMTGGQTGYDGTANAWKMESNSTSGLLTQSFTSTGGVKTYSFYVKKGTTDGVVIRVDPTDGAPAQIEFYVNLNDGSFMTGSAGAQNYPKIFNKIEAVGGGWYRPQITFDEPIDEVKIILASHDPNANPVYSTGVVSNGSIFIQNAQLEDGIVATPVMESVGGITGKAGILEDEPRFDYTEVTCPHLLMEPKRKNMHKYSEYRTAASFFNSTGLLGFESPEGVNNAYKISADSSSNSHFVVNGMITGLTSDAKHTASVFVKAGTNISDVKFGISDQQATTNFAYAYFDITGDGTVGVTHEGGTGTLHRKTIEKIGTDGWYRVSVTATVTHDNAQGLKSTLFMSNDGSDPVSFTDSTAFFYAYGWQFEVNPDTSTAAFATSYIPNHGNASGVTRNQDETHALDLSDYMDGKDITMLVDLAKNPLLDRDSASTGIRLGKRNHNFSAFRFYRPGVNKRTAVYFADRDNDPYPVSHQITTAGRVKVVVRRVEATGEFTIFYAGAQKHQQFNSDFGDFANLQMKADGQPMYINSVIIFDRALTDDEAKSLTTV